MDWGDSLNDEYRGDVDIRAFCQALQHAWLCVPDKQFDEFIDIVFGGGMDELTAEEMLTVLNEFILQNG